MPELQFRRNSNHLDRAGWRVCGEGPSTALGTIPGSNLSGSLLHQFLTNGVKKPLNIGRAEGLPSPQKTASASEWLVRKLPARNPEGGRSTGYGKRIVMSTRVAQDGFEVSSAGEPAHASAIGKLQVVIGVVTITRGNGTVV